MLTITFPYWLIPTIITIGCYVYVLYIYDDGGTGYGSGIGNIFMLIPASIISLVTWIVYAIFK